jgi:hypothetical protein
MAIVILVGILGLTRLMKTPTAMNATFVGVGGAALIYLAINYCRSTTIRRPPPDRKSTVTPLVHTPPQTPAPPRAPPNLQDLTKNGTLRGGIFSSQPPILDL